MATNTPALAVVMVVGVVLNVAAISGVTVMMDVLINVMGRLIQQTTYNVTQRRQVGILATTSSENGTGGSSRLGPEAKILDSAGRSGVLVVIILGCEVMVGIIVAPVLRACQAGVLQKADYQLGGSKSMGILNFI